MAAAYDYYDYEDGALDESQDQERVAFEMATNRLQSGQLKSRSLLLADEGSHASNLVDDVDWVERLRNRSAETEVLQDDAPAPPPRPGGMHAHAAATKIAPTVGARLTTGLRRTTLLVALAVLVGGALAGGAYLLASTSWLATLVGAPAPASPAQAPADEGANTNTPADVSALLAGVDARDLRDKGIAQLRGGNYEAAVKDLEESVRLNSDDPMAYFQLGSAYMAANGREHALDDAEMAFRSSIALQPDWAPAHRMLAESMLRRGYFREAIAPALDATRIDPAMAEGWLTLGKAYEGAGEQAKATEAFAEAARYAPAPPAQP